MKIARFAAWLLVFTLLMTIVPAFGEELTAPPVDDAVPEAQVDLGESGGDLPSELPETALEGGPDEANSAGQDAIFFQDQIDNDTLFAGYVDMLFGKKDVMNLLPKGYIGDRLSGLSKIIYDTILQEIKVVAAGARASTRLTVAPYLLPDFDLDENFGDVASALIAVVKDCPYHLFWFDRTSGVTPEYNGNEGLVLPFPVAQEYAKDTYETDARRIQSAQIAVTNARNVVTENEEKTDYEKLYAYRQYICEEVQYNMDAVTEPIPPYGNPWQLIWVFDDDPDTNVVCEGYAKAFQYLCDLTDFTFNIRAYSATGNGGSTLESMGGHMWNIVTMENGRSYIVDVTFCDTGLPEDFLAGATFSEDGNYFSVMGGRAWYSFDSPTRATFPSEIQALSAEDYMPAVRGVTIDQGRSATVYMGHTLTLSATLSPVGAKSDLTWTSSTPTVAKVSSSGVVTPKKAGKTVVTVQTANGRTASITVRVKDVSRVRLKEGSSKTLTEGSILTLHAVVTPSEVKTKLKWSSSNRRVATVSSSGVVKAIRKGTAIIKVKASNGKYDKIKIKVK